MSEPISKDWEVYSIITKLMIMQETTNTFKWMIHITMIIAIAVLFYCGMEYIMKSNAIYDQSDRYIQQALKDSILKSKLNFAPSNHAILKEGYSQSLLFFSLAIGIILLYLLLPRIQSFSVGGINITLRDLTQKVEQLTVQANDVQSKTTEEGGIKPLKNKDGAESSKSLLTARKGDEETINDPQKGRWGGRSEANGRRLLAIVKPTVYTNELWEVTLIVKSITDKPLTGNVHFHLHNTFKNQDPMIAAIHGEAKLVLPRVYGAFTVGAEADNGNTQLELDLSELKDENIPMEFKSR